MKNVIFDLGNVLVAYDWKGYLNTFSFDDKTYHAVADAVFLNQDWVEGDKGVPKEEWEDMFIANAPAYEKEIKRVYKTLGNCIYRYDYTLKLIGYFRTKGYKIYFLSNYSEGLYEKTKDSLSFIENFDGGVFSFREKCVKPDETLYKILIKRYDINVDETIFLDDREENIKAACNLGLHGILADPGLKEKIRTTLL